MKKFFTLIAAVAMTASVNAQVFTFDTEYAKGKVPASITSNGLVLTITDPEGKTEVDKNSQYFGTADSYKKFDTRFKTNGKSTSTKNFLTLTLPSDGILKVYARTGSSSAKDRNIILTQGETELLNKVLLESEAVKVDMQIDGETVSKSVFPVISVAAKAGDISIKYPVNGVNFYGFELVGSTNGISTISSVASAKSTATYNLAGQQVSDSYKGIVIQNGKKFLKK